MNTAKSAVKAVSLGPEPALAGAAAGITDPGELERLKSRVARRAILLTPVSPALRVSLEEIVPRFGAHLSFSDRHPVQKGFSRALIIAGDDELTAAAAALLNRGGASAGAGKVLARSLSRLNKNRPTELRLGGRSLALGKKTLIMGILNVTPDSFSDGGRFNSLEKALEQAYRMAGEGADIIDIGGESTRPGSNRISAEEELKRVLPVVETLKKERSFKLPLSVDTYKAAVAEKALEAGADMLNDVWGLKEDPELGAVAARFRVPICLMHNRAGTDYENLIPDIICELEESIELALQAGIEDRQIVIDPGIGFGKNLDQNLGVMRHLKVFCALGYPLLLGTSRKSLIGKTLDLPPEERLEGTAATVACGIAAGADLVRVHDVAQMRRVAAMTDAMIRR